MLSYSYMGTEAQYLPLRKEADVPYDPVGQKQLLKSGCIPDQWCGKVCVRAPKA